MGGGDVMGGGWEVTVRGGGACNDKGMGGRGGGDGKGVGGRTL